MENKTQLKGLNLHLCEQTQEFMNDDVTERNFLIGLNAAQGNYFFLIIFFLTVIREANNL